MTFSLSDDDIKRCREVSLVKRELIMDIVRAVCAETGITVAMVLGSKRNIEIVAARQLICYIADSRGHGMASIGRVIRKDHTTVRAAINREKAARAE